MGELAQGIYGVQQICETGNYICPTSGQEIRIERRRKSLPPQSLEQAQLDTDDRFHEVMQEFVEHNLEEAENIAEGAFTIILLYKQLAVYFGDLKSVYPPPKKDNDSAKDLCD